MYQGLHSKTSTTDPQAPYSGEYKYETLHLGKEMTAPDSSLFLDSTANLSINIPSNLFDLMPNGVVYGRMLYQDDNPHDCKRSPPPFEKGGLRGIYLINLP